MYRLQASLTDLSVLMSIKVCAGLIPPSGETETKILS